jgi:hypothetical protein
MNQTYGLMFWIERVITQKIPWSPYFIVVVALHSTGYSRLSPFSCLVVAKLLRVLLLSQCKVPPMGTLVFHGHLALVIVLDLPLMSTHASVLVDSVGPPSAEVCRVAANFP